MKKIELSPPSLPENNNITIPFSVFLTKTYPKTNPRLRNLVGGIIAGFETSSGKNEKGQFAIIRGGAMRALILEDIDKQNMFSKVFKKIPNYSLAGSAHPTTAAVVKEAFHPVRDLDIRLFPNGEPGNNVDQIYRNILQLGLTQEESHPNIFFNDFYKIIISGSNQTTNQCQVNIYSINNSSVLFRLDIADLPKDFSQLNKNSRFSQYSSDFDQVLLGFISTENGLSLTYNITEDSYKVETIFNNFLDFSYRTVFNTNLAVYLPVQARSIGFRAASLLDSKHENLSFDKMWRFIRKNFGNIFPLKNIVNQMILFQNEELTRRRVTVLSDFISALTINPFFSLSAFYLCQDLNWTPLGQLISDDQTLVEILNYMLNELDIFHQIDSVSEMSQVYYRKAVLNENPNLLGPFMIIRALKYLGKLDQSTSESVSNLLTLLDPLLLPENQWKQYLEYNLSCQPYSDLGGQNRLAEQTRLKTTSPPSPQTLPV